MTNNLDFLKNDSLTAASDLLGCYLEREIDGNIVTVKIVETEAYDQNDAASHSFKGQTERTKIMFGPAGYLYVYFTYGMHYCCNIVTDKVGVGSAVLIRAVEPINGIDMMEKLRRRQGIEISNGPAKLCEALNIDKTLNGHDLSVSPLKLLYNQSIPKEDIVISTRIGISKAKDELKRFYIKDNPYVSRV